MAIPSDAAELQKLEQLGVRHLQHETDDDGNVVAVRFYAHTVTNAAMPAIANLKRLRTLDLSGTQVTDDGLARIGGLVELRMLGLPPAATDTCLERLTALTQLEQLYTGESCVQGGALAGLSLKALQEFDAWNSPLRDAGLAALAGSTGLKRLVLRHTKVTSGGLEHLADLAELEYLDLRDTAVGDAGLVHLAGLKMLRHLDLSDTSEDITDSGIAQLANLTKMQSLWLSGSKATDDCVDSFAAMDRLVEMSLWRTQVSDRVFKRLDSLKSFQDKRLHKFHISGARVSENGLNQFRNKLAEIHKSNHRLNP